MFSPDLMAGATQLLADLRARRLKVALAESCTGGLIAALLTEIPGSSDVVDRGFIPYSNEAKSELLGVSGSLITAHGAVSAEVAMAMADGCLAHSRADIAVAVTGVAGPGGGSSAKPVGLVHIGGARIGHPTTAIAKRYPDTGRSSIRLATIGDALAMVRRLMG